MTADRRWLILTSLVLLVAAFAVAIVIRNVRADARSTALTATGVIESDEMVLSSEVAGRIASIPIREGDSVVMGDVVAKIDDALIQLQITQAPDPATRRQLELQAERYVVHSPVTGTITRVPARPGEVVAPGQPLAGVADLTELEVLAYVLERDLARVALRQPASISTGAHPGQAFPGTVTYISSSAEFTPRNIQTQRDRQNLVFGVKIQVGDYGGMLRPGMPVDVTFGQ